VVPDVIFHDEWLVNIRALWMWASMAATKGLCPSDHDSAWMYMTTSQDPGSLGIYGFRNRSDYSYEKLGFANSIKNSAIWDQLARGQEIYHHGSASKFSATADSRHQRRLLPDARSGERRIRLSRQH
jgi:hypothetical protein